MKQLVTGANGHLGNNILRYLLSQNISAIAGVRNVNHLEPFAGLNAEIRQIDLLDRQSIEKALEGVDVLYQAAAVFKRWAKNPKKEIIDANIEGTRNIIEIAAKKGVKKIVYISSLASVNRQINPFDGTTWNPTGKEEPYIYSKTEAEKLAHQLGHKYDLDITFILPSLILGPHFYTGTPSIDVFKSTFGKQLKYLPDFKFLMVDVRDVAKACHNASIHGKSFERYVTSYEKTVSIADLFIHLQKHYPDKNYLTPKPITKGKLLFLASLSEIVSKITNKPPLMTRAVVLQYSEAKFEQVDISKAKSDLTFTLTDIEQSIQDTYSFIESLKE